MVSFCTLLFCSLIIIHEIIGFVQCLEGLLMQEFDINIHSFSEVQDFVSLATVQPFSILVGNDHQLVNAKSFMGMFSLDYTQPVQVHVDCDGEEFDRFRQTVTGFFAK